VRDSGSSLAGCKRDIHLVELEGILFAGMVGGYGPVAIQGISDEGWPFTFG
jgi:hypothetical protein